MAESRLVSFKNVKYGKDKKGRDMTSLYLNPEQAQLIAEEIAAQTDSERGVKITVFATEEEAPWGGTKVNAFAFVNPIEAPGAGYKKAGGTPKGKFVPKAKGMSPETRAKAAATLNTEVE